MNLAIHTIALAALTLSAAAQSVFAVDHREPSESVPTVAGSEKAVPQIAQADTSISSLQAGGARQRAESGSPDPGPGARGARVAASQGPDALRRYVDRTRMIYALDFQQFKVSQP